LLSGQGPWVLWVRLIEAVLPIPAFPSVAGEAITALRILRFRYLR
jgi:hypothetical protein